jgi:rhomboid protease GluP
MDSNEPIDSLAGTAEAPSLTVSATDPVNVTYAVRFSKFLSGARSRNSFDLAHRGEVVVSPAGIVVRGFRREMLFFGTRVELVFSSSDISDVFQLANFVSLTIASSKQNARTLKFWTQNEDEAKRIATALPNTLSAEGMALNEYQSQLKLLDRGDLVTRGLIIANVLVFGAAGLAGAGFFVPNVEVLQSWGTNIGPLTTAGQWWRLVSSMFLHFGIFHLALNMWALYVGGRLAERLFGSCAFALLYFAAGLGGSLSSLLWNPAVNSAGASGAIFGVYGAMLGFFLRKHSAIPASVIRQQRWSGIVFIGYNLLNGFSNAGIDNADHVGGLAIGFILGLVFARPIGTEARAQINVAPFYLRGTAVASMLIGILVVSVHFSPAGNVPEQTFRRDILRMIKSEQYAQQFAKDAFDQLRSRQITPKEFSEQIESQVLPRWTVIQTTFANDRVPGDSKLRPLWELLDDYSESRLAAFKLFDSGARTGKTADFGNGQKKLDQGEIDLKLIRDLNQGVK